MPTTSAKRESVSSTDIYLSSPTISLHPPTTHTYRLCRLILQNLRDVPQDILAILAPHNLPLLVRIKNLRERIVRRPRDLSIRIIKATPPRSNARLKVFLETTARKAGEGCVRCVRPETDLAIKVCYQRRIKCDLLLVWGNGI